MKPRLSALLIPLLGTVLASCEPYRLSPDISSTANCDAGSAQIRIGDGFSEVLCGCKLEAAGTVAVAPSPLNCTIDAGTTVFFRFETSQTVHQIMPDPSSPDFPRGLRMAPADPTDIITQTPFAITFPTASVTYPYIDLFSQDQGIRGNIIVQ